MLTSRKLNKATHSNDTDVHVHYFDSLNVFFPALTVVQSRVRPHYRTAHRHTADHHQLRHVPRGEQLLRGGIQGNIIINE